MADLSITAANVGFESGSIIETLIVAQATNHGQTLYQNGTTYALADADVLASAAATHIAITSATASGQTVSAIRKGGLRLGAILTQGTEYYVSTTPGGICPKADLSTGDYVRRLGIATSTSVLYVEISNQTTVL